MRADHQDFNWKERRLIPVSDLEGTDYGIDDHNFLEGVRAFCQGEFATARRRFTAVLLNESTIGILLAAQGHCWLHEGNQEKAMELYRRASNAKPGLPEVEFNKAQIYISQRSFSRAIPLLRKLYHSPPSVRKGEFYFGLLFHHREDFLCDVCLHLGMVFLNLKRQGEAREWFETALDHNPKSVPAHQRLGEILIHGKSYLAAINHLKSVLEHSPLEEDKIHAINNLGIACYENGMREEAVGYFKTVLRKSPGNPTAIHNLNYIYEAEGVLDAEDRAPNTLRFVDVREGASPIFGLESGDANRRDQPRVIGQSPSMMQVMRHARIAAASDTAVLITGERGTGKELLAKVIALNSSRRDGPFRVINCSSFSEMNLESEIFGHEKGAFTGARDRKEGLLELCSSGSLLLKEVDKFTPMLQSRLLRAMREKHFSPMGGMREAPLTVRIICSVIGDLREKVESGQFREDLFYELNVIAIPVPPLRERLQDVPLLVDHFLHQYARNPESPPPGMSPDDLAALMEYDWPGNVRELENLIARAVVMGAQSNLYMEEVAKLRKRRNSGSRIEKIEIEDGRVSYPKDITLADLEQRHILQVLELNGNNQRKAAKVLGINPSTLWRKLKNYDR